MHLPKTTTLIEQQSSSMQGSGTQYCGVVHAKQAMLQLKSYQLNTALSKQCFPHVGYGWPFKPARHK